MEVRLKGAYWPKLFSLADQVIVPSTATRDLMLSLDVPAEYITLTPYSVDNDWWIAQSAKVDRKAVRADWGATPETSVVLFCAKLQPWKRPLDLLRAFAQASLSDALLVYAGDGAQRQELEREAAALGVTRRVRFLGIPESIAATAGVYICRFDGASIRVRAISVSWLTKHLVVAVPSQPATTSVQRGSLIAPVDSGLLYPSGDVRLLSTLLSELCRDPERLHELGRLARNRMNGWSPQDTVAGTVAAVSAAVRHRQG